MISALTSSSQYPLVGKYYETFPKIGTINKSSFFKYSIFASKNKIDEQTIQNLKSPNETMTILTNWKTEFAVESYVLLNNNSLYMITGINERIIDDYAYSQFKGSETEKTLSLMKVTNSVGVKI